MRFATSLARPKKLFYSAKCKVRVYGFFKNALFIFLVPRFTLIALVAYSNPQQSD